MPLLAQFEGLGSWLVHPGLLAAGAAATAAPIVIHLLNRRRFHIVEWAAMEFLLVAEQQNRRRLELENLLLLVLRCLAVFLIGMLLARPLLPSSPAAGFSTAGRVERIILVDDSLSMQASVGNETSFDIARRRLTDLAAELAQSRSGELLTVVLLSQPASRVLDAVPVSVETVADVRERIERLQCGAGRIELGAALERVENSLATGQTDAARIVNLVTDLRAADWRENAPAEQLKRLAPLVQGGLVIDVGGPEAENLSVVALKTEGLLISGVPTALEVSIKNQGTVAASGVRVSLTPEGLLPASMSVAELQPLETAMVRFPLLLGERSRLASDRPPVPRKIKVEVENAALTPPDRLAADNVAYFPARLAEDIRVLLIDGEPGDREEASESYFLARALAPAGPVAAGIAATVVSAADAASIDLDEYRVVFLLNADRLGDSPVEAAARLRQWVAQGGGLVVMPGDRVEARTFNELYVRGDAGLAPLALERVRGDDAHMRWEEMQSAAESRGFFGQFAGEENVLLQTVKVFQWWGSIAPAEGGDGPVRIVARINDPDRAPIAAERNIGNGKVVLFTVPADDEWHNWPSHPSYLLLMQDLVRSLVSDTRTTGLVEVGELIVEQVDIAKYAAEAELVGPDEGTVHVNAIPPEGTPEHVNAASWQLTAPTAAGPGFYALQLERRGGSPETRLFAANVSPVEGDLRRADERLVAETLSNANFQVVKGTDGALPPSSADRNEVARQLIWLVAAVLACEQALGWWFGRRRT